MIKIPEYMAMGCPIASYELPETRISAGPAAAYAAAPTPESLGLCVHELLEDPERRRQMGRSGQELVAELSWQRSSTQLLAAYDRAMGSENESGERAASPKVLAHVSG
jgi:glycosyltransferase involved in cell wall biosynthesis